MKPSSPIALGSLLSTAPRSAFFQEPGWHVWCGSVTQGPEGDFYLIYSRWPLASGFDGWVTHSEIALARSSHMAGPFVPVGPILSGAGGDTWDAHVTHNPTVIRDKDRYYLYYMGNRGDGSFWDHRNHQRIGVAWADHPTGPWHRSNQPLIEVNPQSWDALITSNPSVAATGDGRFLMVYKTVSQGPLPFGGKVLHAVAFANHPTGPFLRLPDPVFTHPTQQFPAEDPFIWKEDQGFRAVVKDMAGGFTEVAPSLAEFVSADGMEWTLAKAPMVTACEIPWEGGEKEKVQKLERPQLIFAENQPVMLRAAILRNDGSTGNVGLMLRPVAKN